MNKRVAVWVITYNQENLIEDCINSILSQKMSGFNVDVFIGYDKSTDSTLKKLSKFRSLKNVTLLERPNRLGYHENFIDTLEYLREDYDYIAMCEGDDYWIDSSKLKKQVEFLEKNHDFFLTFHDGLTDKNGIIQEQNFSKFRIKNNNVDREVLTKEIISSPARFCHLSSLVYRNNAQKISSILRSSFYDAPVLDTPLINILSTCGRNYYFSDKMFVQREYSTSITKSREYTQKYLILLTKMLDNIDKILDRKFSQSIIEAKNGRKFRTYFFLYKKEKFVKKIYYLLKSTKYLKYTNYSIRDFFYLLRH